MRSPALSCPIRSSTLSHSGVAYSGWEPTSRYNRAPFSRKTFDDRPQWTTRRNRYLATSSGDRRRWPRKVQVTPYSFSRPKIRRSMGLVSTRGDVTGGPRTGYGARSGAGQVAEGGPGSAGGTGPGPVGGAAAGEDPGLGPVLG